MLKVIFLPIALVMTIMGSKPLFATGTDLSLTSLVVEVKRALLAVNKQWDWAGLPLETVVVNLRTVTVAQSDGGLSVYVVTFDADASAKSSNSTKLVLSPPPASSASDVSVGEIGEALADAIILAGEAVAEARRGQPPLIAEEVVVEVSFLVEAEAGGGFKVRFPPFSASLGASINESVLHSLTATFAR